MRRVFFSIPIYINLRLYPVHNNLQNQFSYIQNHSLYDSLGYKPPKAIAKVNESHIPLNKRPLSNC